MGVERKGWCAAWEITLFIYWFQIPRTMLSIQITNSETPKMRQWTPKLGFLGFSFIYSPISRITSILSHIMGYKLFLLKIEFKNVGDFIEWGIKRLILIWFLYILIFRKIITTCFNFKASPSQRLKTTFII